MGIDAVVLSTQHDRDVSQADIHEAVMELIVKEVLPAELAARRHQFHINPTGQFIIGGPVGDCGLTGRKIIVDTYGGMARHGGGAFSGKDPSKVDRSAAYAGRYVAKNIVAAGLADQCEIQVSYAIGVAQPTSISVNTFGTGRIATTRSSNWYASTSICARTASPTCLICCTPCTGPRQLTATSAASHKRLTVGDKTFTTFRGKRRIAPPRLKMPLASN